MTKKIKFSNWDKFTDADINSLRQAGISIGYTPQERKRLDEFIKNSDHECTVNYKLPEVKNDD